MLVPFRDERLQLALPDEPAEDDDEAGEETPRIGAQDLAKFLAATYTDAGWSRTDHYDWISGLLAELGITTVEALEQVLAPVDEAAIRERMGYQYPPGAVRRLDDALLATHGKRYVTLPGNAHRAASLETRLAKLGPDGRSS
jgi:hypothetical protein